MYFLSSGGMRAGNFPSTRALARRIWSPTGRRGAANSPDPPSEQKLQPPVPRVPSLLGQVQPLVSDSL